MNNIFTPNYDGGDNNNNNVAEINSNEYGFQYTRSVPINATACSAKDMHITSNNCVISLNDDILDIPSMTSGTKYINSYINPYINKHPDEHLIIESFGLISESNTYDLHFHNLNNIGMFIGKRADNMYHCYFYYKQDIPITFHFKVNNGDDNIAKIITYNTIIAALKSLGSFDDIVKQFEDKFC